MSTSSDSKAGQVTKSSRYVTSLLGKGVFLQFTRRMYCPDGDRCRWFTCRGSPVLTVRPWAALLRRRGGIYWSTCLQERAGCHLWAHTETSGKKWDETKTDSYTHPVEWEWHRAKRWRCWIWNESRLGSVLCEWQPGFLSRWTPHTSLSLLSLWLLFMFVSIWHVTFHCFCLSVSTSSRWCQRLAEADGDSGEAITALKEQLQRKGKAIAVILVYALPFSRADHFWLSFYRLFCCKPNLPEDPSRRCIDTHTRHKLLQML